MQQQYQPDYTAPAEGEFIREPDPTGHYPQGIATGWRQHHDELVRDALRNWKGSPTEFSLHMQDAVDGAEMPSSGSGKQKRMQAEALAWEIEHKGRPNAKVLHRGGPLASVPQPWSESRKVAAAFAKKHGAGTVSIPVNSRRGIRVADYISSAFDSEREWILCAA